MVGTRALHPLRYSGLYQRRQEFLLLLDAKVRIGFRGEALDGALRERRARASARRSGRVRVASRQDGASSAIVVVVHQYFSKAICPGTPRRLVAKPRAVSAWRSSRVISGLPQTKTRE